MLRLCLLQRSKNMALNLTVLLLKTFFFKKKKEKKSFLCPASHFYKHSVPKNVMSSIPVITLSYLRQNAKNNIKKKKCIFLFLCVSCF